MKHSGSKSRSADRARGLAELIGRAVSLHQRGELEQARWQYQAILRTHPKQFDALYFLGVLELQMGQPEAAHGLMRRALQINPGSAQAHMSMGNVNHAQKKLEESLKCYDRAVALKPDYAEAYNNRGNALLDLGRHELAVESYDRALAVAPDYAEALNNRGNALHGLARYTEALASYERALAVAPAYADAWNSRGLALQALAQHAEALASYERALAIEPDFAEVLNNRGNTLRDLHRYTEALASIDRALALAPESVNALIDRGSVLFDVGRRTDALTSYDRVLVIDATSVAALNNRGNVLMHVGRPEDAIRDFERALTIKSSGTAYLRGALLHSRMQCCDWYGLDEGSRRLIDQVRAEEKAITPFFLLGVAHSTEDQLSCARVWVKDKSPRSEAGPWDGNRYAHDRIRVAYLSSDLRDHPVAYLMARLFEMHDTTRFEVTAISFGSDTDTPGEMRSRLEGTFERFIDVRHQTDPEVAALMRELEIDIAVDLNGHTQGARAGILARRPAPVQVNYLGFAGTLGAEYMDYIVGDRMVIPVEHQPYYTEKVVYLPDTYLANDSTRRIAERTPTRAEAGLPEDGFVFCCFNNTYKITPAVFDIWMRLLRQVEGSVLWLSESNASAIHNLRREASERGIAPERLIFAQKVQQNADHLARQRLADLFLDTLPYNAHATASDALWAGLPIVTCMGTTFAGRVAASLLNAIGLPELIKQSLDEYEQMAIRLATDREMLAGIKAKLARNRDSFPLFDTDRFRRNIEAAYTTMWERSQRGEPPTSFAIDPVQ